MSPLIYDKDCEILSQKYWQENFVQLIDWFTNSLVQHFKNVMPKNEITDFVKKNLELVVGAQADANTDA